jgi:hypothetical protein
MTGKADSELGGVEHRFARVGGTKIHYMIAGEGDPVLLIHGADIDDFIQWYCSEPRLAFNRIVVTRYCSVPDTRPRYDERSRSSCRWVRQFPEQDRAATMPISNTLHFQKSSAGTCNLPTVHASNRRHEKSILLRLKRTLSPATRTGHDASPQAMRLAELKEGTLHEEQHRRHFRSGRGFHRYGREKFGKTYGSYFS